MPEAICDVRHTGSRVDCEEEQSRCQEAAVRLAATPAAAICPRIDSHSARESPPAKCLQRNKQCVMAYKAVITSVIL